MQSDMSSSVNSYHVAFKQPTTDLYWFENTFSHDSSFSLHQGYTYCIAIIWSYKHISRILERQTPDLRVEPPIRYSNISLSLYLEAELIAGTGLKTYQFLRGSRALFLQKHCFKIIDIFGGIVIWGCVSDINYHFLQFLNKEFSLA